MWSTIYCESTPNLSAQSTSCTNCVCEVWACLFTSAMYIYCWTTTNNTFLLSHSLLLLWCYSLVHAFNILIMFAHWFLSSPALFPSIQGLQEFVDLIWCRLRHLLLDLPIILLPSDLSILIIPGLSYSRHNSKLYLICHYPSSSAGPQNFLRILLSHILNLFSSSWFND
jgi:hypothetical protein